MELKNSKENLEDKAYDDRNLEIFFEIKSSSLILMDDKNINSILSALEFKDSNHKLSTNEIIRASLRPDYLVLDDKRIYSKKGERAYLDGNEKNILKINYYAADNRL